MQDHGQGPAQPLLTDVEKAGGALAGLLSEEVQVGVAGVGGYSGITQRAPVSAATAGDLQPGSAVMIGVPL